MNFISPEQHEQVAALDAYYNVLIRNSFVKQMHGGFSLSFLQRKDGVSVVEVESSGQEIFNESIFLRLGFLSGALLTYAEQSGHPLGVDAKLEYFTEEKIQIGKILDSTHVKTSALPTESIIRDQATTKLLRQYILDRLGPEAQNSRLKSEIDEIDFLIVSVKTADVQEVYQTGKLLFAEWRGLFKQGYQLQIEDRVSVEVIAHSVRDNPVMIFRLLKDNLLAAT